MNAERDSDRSLRNWISEGVDRAPERYVWAALDDIDTLEQRRPWRTTLEGLGRTLRPVLPVVGVAAIVFAAAAISLRIGPQGDVGARRAFTAADLPSIVLWQDTKPASWSLDNLVSNPDEVLRIPIRTMTEAELQSLARPPGYITGRYTDFSAPTGAFMSWSALFASPEQAAAALPFFLEQLESSAGWGFGPGQPIDFGDGGVLYQGETTAFTGPPGTNEPIRSEVYLWRNGNLLLAFGGWFDFDTAEVRAIAEAMDLRAGAASARTRPS